MSVKIVKKASDCTKGREIAAGGEGKIYEHPSDKAKVIKVYHQVRKYDFVKHLTKLSKLPDSFVAPQDIYVLEKTNDVIGFEMQYVNFNDYWLFNNLFNKGFCTSNNIDKAFKIKVLLQLKLALETIHTNNIVIGDLNQYNLFVSRSGDILFVDVDSYQTPDNKHSGVLLDDIRDWTTSDINKSTDVWAYDILAFWSTTYCHPFKWVVPGNKESIEMRVRSKKSILTKIPNVKIPPLYEQPTGKIYDQFLDIFNGRRFMVNFDVVTTPYATAPLVVKQPVATSNQLNIREIINEVTDIHACENYIAVKRNTAIDPHQWLWMETMIQKIVTTVAAIDCEELYPANFKACAYRKADTLYGTLGSKYSKTFQKPIFSFNNGYLTVIEYDIDIQWNFDINNQLAGIDSTNTPVFAKSIIKRDSLLQNFGSKIYLNIPVKNRYSLIEVPNGTKNGFRVNGYLGIEFRSGGTTYNGMNYGIKILEDKKVLADNTIFFEYLPYFAVSSGKTVFVPEDGYIDVYSAQLQHLMKFDCSICTRNSKLFSTKAGIILYENKTIYLLNTK